MEIRKTTLADLSKVTEIFAYAREQMAAAGNPQWSNGRPSEETIRADIEAGNSYVLVAEPGDIRGAEGVKSAENAKGAEGPSLVGVFTLILGEEPTYSLIEDGAWLNEDPYGTLHRIASNGKARGVMQAALAFCESVSPNIRVDTHEKNLAMQHILEKNGYVYCGRIYVEDGTPRRAYQKASMCLPESANK